MRSFEESFKVQKCNNFNTALVDGINYPASGSFIDVGGFGNFAFIVEMGTTTTACVFQVQQATGASATPKNLTGATLTPTGTDDNKTFIIEAETARLDIANDYHYVSLDCSGAAGADDYACITFLGWNARHVPVTQGSDVSANVVVAG
ncbi:MAG: hypothetical protein ABIG63_14085 [Chloroflexota bacterium]